MLDGEGEVYVNVLFNTGACRAAERGGHGAADGDSRAPGRETSPVRLYLPKWDEKGMQVARFRIPASRQSEDRQKFYELKLAHYEDLLSRSVPGAAWFRHEARQAREALGKKD